MWTSVICEAKVGDPMREEIAIQPLYHNTLVHYESVTLGSELRSRFARCIPKVGLVIGSREVKSLQMSLLRIDLDPSRGLILPNFKL